MEPELQVIGSIERIEIIAAGSGIAELANLRKLFGEGRWPNLKALQACDCRPGTFGHAKYIGMKRMASASAS